MRRPAVAGDWRSACAALLLAAACLLGGCGGGSTGPFPEAPVVLVSIDTLRADRLASYGYRAGRTPTLDALAREGVVFDDVTSPCPLTLPAHASMLTGLLPPRHGVRDNLGFALAADRRTLATRFAERGRETGGAVSAYVLRRATGIAQGFAFYDDELPVNGAIGAIGDQQRDGAVAVESLARWIDGRPSPRFFAFLHLYEPHAPYQPPPQHRDLADAYDGEVAYADELVGRLFARLRAHGLYDRAIIVVVSDHGEGLRDHGEQEHGLFLYREAVHVPLLVRLPRARLAGTRVAGVVPLVDLAPTLLELAGLGGSGMDGASQRAALLSGHAAPRQAYSETLYPRYHFGWSETFAVTDERYHFIRAPRSELFDRKSDAAEKRNLAADRPEVAAAAARWLDGQVGSARAPAPAAVSDETRAALQALGYVGSTVTLDAATSALPDPKDKLATYEAYRRAMEAKRAGRAEQAVRELRTVLADSPGMLDAWESLGAQLVRLGREREGIAAFEEVVRRDPENASAHLALARIHGMAGRAERAARHAELASRKEPGRGFETLALLYLDRNQPEQAAAAARRSLDADPDRVMSAFVLGKLAQRAGRCPDAVGFYSRAVAAQQRRSGLTVRGLHAGLGDCLARLGRETQAEAEFRSELELVPWSREARVGLAVLLRSQGRDGEVRDALAALVTANPRAGADDYLLVARTLASLGDLPAAREWAARGRTLYPTDARFRR